MKKFISKYLVPAFMLFVLLKPHAERIAFQGGFSDGAQYTQIQFEGTFGLPVPGVQLMSSNDDVFADSRLELNSDFAVFSFTPGASVQDGTTVTLQTKIEAVSLQSESSFGALPYDIYATLNSFELAVTDTTLNSASAVTFQAVPSYNQNGLTSGEITSFLNRFDIPVTFSRDEISAALAKLSDSDLDTLISNSMIDEEGNPMWSITTLAEIEINLSGTNSPVEVTYPLFPGYSDMKNDNQIASAFCSENASEAGTAAHHMIDFNQFENLSEVIIRSGNREQSATCLKGSRSNLANSYTISGPGLEKNGFSEVLFVKS
ncbi:hypothetical protein [Rhodohalobacter mucosus]|uniref:Uncharacterized protein n=1 Tax=Rhodohalobacter mucosus TaxID=2079485 RepID=A0A316TXI2_9BACT|nr:hypothetical protein [Rhodohalobacter mucosus]PWN07372.1 hypothetical protein DDZ15_03660 [Rhodohalobacter mucosus]